MDLAPCALTVLLAFIFTLITPAEALSTPGDVETDWLVTGEGLGKYQGVEKSIATLRSVYPELTISYERRIRVKDKALNEPPNKHSFRGDVVARKDNVELFRADCWCEYDVKRRQWRLAQSGAFGLESIEIRETIAPSTTDPRFKTAAGIGVGNSVAELRSAYHSYAKTNDLVFLHDDSWAVKGGKHYGTFIACFRRKSDHVTTRTDSFLEFIGFRIETIELVIKKNNTFDVDGRQLNSRLQDRFQPGAKITEVITGYDCNFLYRHSV